jgi:hypothetical protein
VDEEADRIDPAWTDPVREVALMDVSVDAVSWSSTISAKS